MKRLSTEHTIVAETVQHSPHQQWEVEWRSVHIQLGVSLFIPTGHWNTQRALYRKVWVNPIIIWRWNHTLWPMAMCEDVTYVKISALILITVARKHVCVQYCAVCMLSQTVKMKWSSEKMPRFLFRPLLHTYTQLTSLTSLSDFPTIFSWNHWSCAGWSWWLCHWPLSAVTLLSPLPQLLAPPRETWGRHPMTEGWRRNPWSHTI